MIIKGVRGAPGGRQPAAMKPPLYLVKCNVWLWINGIRGRLRISADAREATMDQRYHRGGTPPFLIPGLGRSHEWLGTSLKSGLERKLLAQLNSQFYGSMAVHIAIWRCTSP